MKKTRDQEILKFLSLLQRSGNSGFVSGQALAKQAGISRSAVWKQIRKLRQYGYAISSVRGQGYRLVSDTLLPVPWELRRGLHTAVFGKKIHYHKVADSTQGVALAIANKEQNCDGTVVIAGQQSSGRGRLKRKWLSPPGGLWFSVILQPKIPTAESTILPFVAALAVREAIATVTNLDVDLKWPNDVMIGGKKVAGILLDISAEADTINYAVIGVGINVNVDASEIAAKIDRLSDITSIRNELGHDVSIVDIVRRILENLEAYLDALYHGGPSEIIKTWKQDCDMLGREVTIGQSGKTMYKGLAFDVDPDGSLVVQLSSGKKVNIASGDVGVRY